MQTNCAPNRNTPGIVSIQNVSYVGVDREEPSLSVTNKQIHPLTHSLTDAKTLNFIY